MWYYCSNCICPGCSLYPNGKENDSEGKHSDNSAEDSIQSRSHFRNRTCTWCIYRNGWSYDFDPMAWQRLSIIGAAPTELTAATLGAEAAGAELGGAGFTLKVMAVSWFVMALNGAGWLVVTGLFTPALENLRTKMSGGDSKWLVVMSGACSLGIFGYLDVNEIGKGWGNAAAVAGGIIGMAILEKFVAKKVPKIREYNLGIAMIIGMLFAIIYDMAVGA